jgi:two-component system, NarL family, response regulator LiaR
MFYAQSRAPSEGPRAGLSSPERNVEGHRRLRVLVVASDPPIYRRGLAAVLAADPAFIWLGEAISADAAAEQSALHDPDLVLLDAELAGGSSLELMRVLLARANTRVAVLTALPDEGAQQRWQAAGAARVLAKDTSAADLLEALRPLCRETPASRKFSGLGDDLTRREVELLELMARGLGNQEIAQRLDIALPTVKFHVTNILAKLHTDNRTAAVLAALRLKLVQLD